MKTALAAVFLAIIRASCHPSQLPKANSRNPRPPADHSLRGSLEPRATWYQQLSRFLLHRSVIFDADGTSGPPRVAVHRHMLGGVTVLDLLEEKHGVELDALLDNTTHFFLENPGHHKPEKQKKQQSSNRQCCNTEEERRHCGDQLGDDGAQKSTLKAAEGETGQRRLSTHAAEAGIAWTTVSDRFEGVIGIAVVHPGYRAQVHSHAEPETYVLLEGVAHMRLGERTYTVQSPAIVYIPGDTPHAMTPHAVSVAVRLLYSFDQGPMERIRYQFHDHYLA
uniref:Cupin type-2 domain-containing protein n=1 Tax=Lotharella oceanica TaxID=641309 RepID=A0A7S2THU0_9EUKA|mmetsp:Transcript_14850/g.28255  ORF Transcript_14850/g.28255 Transcript_14850/m.28255 type:complete len:279 (+) Transcript_14850:86-922(+)